MKRRYPRYLLMTGCMLMFLWMASSCGKTVYTTQSGQTWTEYKSAKNNNGQIVNKTKKPKTKNKKKQNW